MSATFVTGTELFDLEPRGFVSKDDRIQRRIAVKRVWCAIVRYNKKGRSPSADDALRMRLSLKEINTGLKQDRSKLWGNIQDYEMNAFEATLKDWKKRNIRK